MLAVKKPSVWYEVEEWKRGEAECCGIFDSLEEATEEARFCKMTFPKREYKVIERQGMVTAFIRKE